MPHIQRKDFKEITNEGKLQTKSILYNRNVLTDENVENLILTDKYKNDARLVITTPDQAEKIRQQIEKEFEGIPEKDSAPTYLTEVIGFDSEEGFVSYLDNLEENEIPYKVVKREIYNGSSMLVTIRKGEGASVYRNVEGTN